MEAERLQPTAGKRDLEGCGAVWVIQVWLLEQGLEAGKGGAVGPALFSIVTLPLAAIQGVRLSRRKDRRHGPGSLQTPVTAYVLGLEGRHADDGSHQGVGVAKRGGGGVV